MNITLANFQIKAIADLTAAMKTTQQRYYTQKLYRQRKNYYSNEFYG